MRTLGIHSKEDLDIVMKAILNGEDFKFGEIKPFLCTIKLQGGRFEHYDVRYIDADIAWIILKIQDNYEELLGRIEKIYDIKFKEEYKVLRFRVEEGSLELLSELFGILSEVAKNMESIHVFYSIAVLAGCFTSYKGFSLYLDSKQREIENQKAIKMRELENEDKEKYANFANNALETLSQFKIDKTLQNATNNPKKEILSILDNDEKVTIFDEEPLYNTNISDFEYKKPEIEDIEFIEEKELYIETYNFYKDGKLFKFVGQTGNVNSETISTEDRMELIRKADKKEPVKVKIKYIKDGVTNKIKNMYIMELIR